MPAYKPEHMNWASWPAADYQQIYKEKLGMMSDAGMWTEINSKNEMWFFLIDSPWKTQLTF